MRTASPENRALKAHSRALGPVFAIAQSQTFLIMAAMEMHNIAFNQAWVYGAALHPVFGRTDQEHLLRHRCWLGKPQSLCAICNNFAILERGHLRLLRRLIWPLPQ